jgi:hypothetical protein
LEHERDLVAPQEISKFSVKPGSIPNFDGKLVIAREFLQERNKPVQKFMPIFEYSSIEEWELKDNRT